MALMTELAMRKKKTLSALLNDARLLLRDKLFLASTIISHLFVNRLSV